MEEEDVNNDGGDEGKKQVKVFVAMAGTESEGIEITDNMLKNIPGWLKDPTPEQHLAFRKVYKLLNDKIDLHTTPKQLYRALKPAAIPGVTLSLISQSLRKARKREKAILDDFLYLMGGGQLPDVTPWYKFKECRGRRNSMPYGVLTKRKDLARDNKEEKENADESEDEENDDPAEREATFFTAIAFLHEARPLGDIYEYYRERQKPPEDELWDFYTQMSIKVFAMNNRQLKDAYFLAKRKAKRYDPILEPPMLYSPTEKIPSPLPTCTVKRYMRVNLFLSEEDEEEDRKMRREEKEQVAAFCSKNVDPETGNSACTCAKYMGCNDDKAVAAAIKIISTIGGTLARLPNIHLLFKQPNVRYYRKLKILRAREGIRGCDDDEFALPNPANPLFSALNKDVNRHIKPNGLIRVKIPRVAHATVVYTLLPYIRREKEKALGPVYEDVKRFKVMSSWVDYKNHRTEKLKTNLPRQVIADLYDAYGASTVRKADVQASLRHVGIKKNKGNLPEQSKCPKT